MSRVRVIPPGSKCSYLRTGLESTSGIRERLETSKKALTSLISGSYLVSPQGPTRSPLPFTTRGAILVPNPSHRPANHRSHHTYSAARGLESLNLAKVLIQLLHDCPRTELVVRPKLKVKKG